LDEVLVSSEASHRLMIKVAEMRATFEHVAQQVSFTFKLSASSHQLRMPPKRQVEKGSTITANQVERWPGQDSLTLTIKSLMFDHQFDHRML
jgi:hypothetical protein